MNASPPSSVYYSIKRKKEFNSAPKMIRSEGPSSRVQWAWVIIFSIWLIIVSGFFSKFLGGAPGILQALKLRDYLSERQNQVAFLENEIKLLEIQKQGLLTDRKYQEKEVRRVLGFVAKDELVFDFSGAEFGPKKLKIEKPKDVPQR